MTKPRKLAFCVLRYFPYGGVQRDMMGTVWEAVNRGYLVDIYCITWEGPKPSHQAIQVFEVSVFNFSNHGRAFAFAKKLKHIFNQNYYFRKISFNRLPYTDVCFIGDHCFLEHVTLKASRLVNYLPRYKYYAKLERGIFQSNSQAIVINPNEKKIYEKYFPDKKNNLHLIAPWVQEKILTEQEYNDYRKKYRKQFKVQDHEFLILFMASQFKAKGLDRVLLAVSHLPDQLKKNTKLIIAGDGKKKFCFTKIEQYKIADQAIYLGPCDFSQGLMCAADLFAHPARVELAGKVLLEAIINNLPVLTTDVCGCAPYIIQANSGEVLKGKYQQENLDQVLQTMLDREQLNNYKNQARQFPAKNSFADFPKLVLNIAEQTPAQGADKFYLNDQVMNYFPETRTACLAVAFRLSGKVFRAVKTRKTMAVKLDQKDYFLKLHYGIGWREIFKNLITLRLPVISAKQEARAIKRLQQLGVKTPEIMAYAESSDLYNPAKITSFILTKTVDYNLTLEDLGKKQQKLPLKFKRALIKRVAEIARTMHQNNINHRDFYICHFLLCLNSRYSDSKPLSAIKYDTPFDLVLIDLHRAIVHRKALPERWLIKDLAGLYFSTMDIGLSKADYGCFLVNYYQDNLKAIMEEHVSLWQKISKKAHKLYAKTHNPKNGG